MIYLAEKAGKLLPTDAKGRATVIQRWKIHNLFENTTCMCIHSIHVSPGDYYTDHRNCIHKQEG